MATASPAVRTWLIVAAVAVVALAAAFFAGGFIEHGKLKTAQKTAAAAQARAARLQSINHVLAADVWSFRAVAALDERNFGVANDDVARAVAELNGVDAAAAGLDAAALKTAQAEAAAVKVSVAVNLQGQRAQLLRLAADIGALATPAPAQSAAA